MRALAIDIGSNAVRAAIGEMNGDVLSVLIELRESVRLGADVFSGGSIKDETISLLVSALKSFLGAGEKYKVNSVKAVGTSALREADNQLKILETIKSALGLDVEVISGEEEARFIGEAVKHAINLSDKRVALIDIGGGSTEISLLDNGEVILSESLPLGSVRLLSVKQKLIPKFVKQHTKSLISRILEVQENNPIDLIIGCGGNCETLLDLKLRFLNEESSSITSEEMKKILETISDVSIENRVQKYGLRPDRADVIVPAILVLRSILDSLKGKVLTIPRVGLRNGILLEVLRTTSSRSERQLIKFAEGLVRRFKGDLNHARTVTKFALQIYDSTNGGSKQEKLYLRLASLLHDIGSSISPEGHHKHTYYILHQVPFVGLTKEEKEIVAQIARYHRKAHPSVKHPHFEALSKESQEIVTRCAAILRIAEALDQEHLPTALSLNVESTTDSLILKLDGNDCELEAWKAQKRADLFEKIYKTKVAVEWYREN